MIPTCAAMASAVAFVSPLSMTTSSPKPLSRATASADSGLTVSATPSTPTTCSSRTTTIGVRPARASSATRSAAPSMDSPACSTSLVLPTATHSPSTRARTPSPGADWKLSVVARPMPRSIAPSTTALAMGCSLARSTDAASLSSSSSARPFKGRTSVRRGLPIVSVPVLSRTTTWSLWACSSAPASRMRMPFSAPLPVPTMMAVGVARPSAQGQAITSTATTLRMAIAISGGGPQKYHTRPVTSATLRTAGTK